MPINLSSFQAKTMRRLTLTSGTSWTVPAGVTFVNVTLYGGGGGGGGVDTNANGGSTGGTGGTTTFTGATSAPGGTGGSKIDGYNAGAGTSITNPQSNAYIGGNPGVKYSTSFGTWPGVPGYPGSAISSTLATTPGSTITYSIGAGGSGGSSASGSSGSNGSSGKIDIEYWV